ncbi:tape measure protein [Fusobacterium mortiferum]|uniref:tape measure protein n=1 Tax=Fusobacterium mortiferum TaxID=850 RepID=UPI00195BC1A0|nr:tape measure protein [Fusobacterium mortiferum]
MATIESSIMLMDGMSKPLNNIVGAINTTIAALQGVNNANINIDTTRLTNASQMITDAGAELIRIEQEIQNQINNNTNGQNRFNQSLARGVKESDGLLSKINKLAAAYVGLQTLRGAINLSDNLTQTTARLDLMNDGNQTTDELQAMIYQAARNSRGDALANIESISKMGLMAGDVFSSNTELIGFMELINKQFKISGTSAEGISAAMLQLTQAMGAGALRGEELNSILEQAPLILKNIANYLKVPVGQIKDLASQGKITSEVVKKAMFNAADTINQQFNSIPLTFADITTSMRNEAVKKFQNISSQFSSALNSERFRGFTNSLVNSIGVVLDIASRGMTTLITLGATIYDNWAIISPVIKSVAGIMAVYAGAVTVSTIANGAMAVAQLASAVAMTIYNVATGQAIALTHAQTMAQWGLNAAILANPITLVIGAAVAALYLGVAAFNHFAGTSVSATGIIVGAFYAIGAVIHNVIGAVYNATLQLGSSIYNYIAGIVEFIGNVFTHPITAISNLFLDFTNFIIDQLKVIGKITDTILGTSVSDTLGEIQNSLNNFVLDKVGENSFKVERKDFSEMMVDYKDPWQAAKNGYNTWNNFSLTDTIQEKNQELLGQIATNTGAMGDSLDLTTEEIKYMKDLAEMEVINRFTTAEIKVEVGGITNQVNNTIDVESIYSNISDKLRETVAVVAEGVYD